MDALAQQQYELAENIKHLYENFRNKHVDLQTLGAANIQLTRLQVYYENFRANQIKIAKLQAANADHPYFSSGVISEAEDQYWDVKGLFTEFILNLESSRRAAEQAAAPRPSAVAPVNVISSHRHLPKIEIPIFSGDYIAWENFRDTFRSIVHTNESISMVDKFHYLRTYVSGKALNLIKKYTISAVNYAPAWETLTKYYENKRRIVHAHLTELFGLKHMKCGSADAINQIINGVFIPVDALKAVGRATEHWDDIVVYIAVSRFEENTLREWHKFLGDTSEPATVTQLKQFLENQLTIFESIDAKIKKPSNSNSHNAKNGSSSNAHQSVPSREASANKNCPCCSGDHPLFKCEDFKEKDEKDRSNFVRSKRRCINCLGAHQTKTCKSPHTCAKCQKKHHTLLHFPTAPKVNHSTITPDATTSTEKSRAEHTPCTSASESSTTHHTRPESVGPSGCVLLATALVKVVGENGSELLVRALIDPCSQSSFISTSLCQRIRARTHKVHVPILGTGGTPITTATKSATVTIKSRISSEISYEVQTLVLPKISMYKPPVSLSSINLPHLDGLFLADPQYTDPASIDVLLGASIYSRIVEGTVVKGGEHEPIATRTTLGWILSGETPGASRSTAVTSLHIASDDCLDVILKSFWEQENVPDCSPLTAAEQECEKHFADTHRRDATGRFIVRLPFKGGGPPPNSRLSDSYFRAKGMFLKLEKQFEREPRFKKAYREQINDFRKLGHMVPRDTLKLDRSYVENSFYLPHHAVLKETSETTKLRTVFNASAKLRSGTSLNDLLHPGPNLLPHLPDLVNGWRMYRFVFSADIEKMFRQILIHIDDVKYQSVLWRDNATELLLVLILLVLAFGLAAASFLANRCVKQVAADHKATHPLGAIVAEEETYMDDVCSGGHSIEEVVQKVKETAEIFALGCFPLRKWIANHESVLANLPKEFLAKEPFALRSAANNTSILGLFWHPVDDCFSFKVNPQTSLEVITKRKILSRIARLFDPLGWLAPVVVTAKMLMRELWLSKTGWDDPVNSDCEKIWRAWDHELTCINEIKIPRWNRFSPDAFHLEIHGFADASKNAYGAAVYLRVVLHDETHVSLQIAKSKSAPVKWAGIPRLELAAAHLLAKLTQHYVTKLRVQPSAVHLWTDSKIVLCWLSKAPSTWETFVANRCSAIHEMVPQGHWHHVKSKQNPADIVSRGCSASELKKLVLWWRGPDYLSESQLPWPHRVDYIIEESDLTAALNSKPARGAASHFTLRESQNPYAWSPICRHSSLLKALRITAYCLRFIFAITAKRPHIVLRFLDRLTEVSEDLAEHRRVTATDLYRSRLLFIKLHQVKNFASTMDLLNKGRDLPKSDPLLKLNPILRDGFLRVGGRLSNSLIPFDSKHPFILHPDDKVAHWLIDEAHRATLHGGPTLTLSTLRLRYWIVKGRGAVKNAIRKCVTCCRWSKKNRTQIMADLPSARVSPSKPFQKSGVDYAGPVKVRLSKGRGNTTLKGYIAVFVCFATHAVHLEIVDDYSSKAFISAFHRFTARRGHCSDLYSDQGTTFVGADRELKTLFGKVQDKSPQIFYDLSADGTRWHFNPPAAPHFGGLWEAAVKSVKYHLVRVIGEQVLTFIEWSTLLCKVEAVLNSRPLGAMSDDVNDLEALTPSHFLINRLSFLVPEPESLDAKIPLSRRYHQQREMIQHVWKRWHTEYLTALHQRHKWQRPQRSVAVGDLVIVKDEQTSPGRWPLGRIKSVHPGKDGRVRTATVTTATTELLRPIVKLIMLDIC